MPERLNPLLRLVCAVLAIWVLFQTARLARPRSRALSEFTPAGVTLSPPTNSPPGKAAKPVPPEILARVEKIKESQILGPVMRPPPMALLGIAGKDALLRSDTGQTGWVREGENLGGVKLLQIGTNRVLIEHQGQNLELVLFQGLGGESLLSKGKESNQ